ncbi:MAG: hypothetical protein AAGF32_03640 [Pseudomonadota bacterium]
MTYERALFVTIYTMLIGAALLIMYLVFPTFFVLLGIAAIIGAFTYGVQMMAKRAQRPGADPGDDLG